MAVTDVTICNYALRLVGGTKITALGTGTNGERCQDLYADLRDDLLRAHTWNFATRYAKLTRNATAPTHSFDYAYDLPSDWLRTISCHDNDAGLGTIDFEEIEVDSTGVIAASVEDVWVRYIYQCTTTARFSADFTMAFQLALARDLAVPVANSNTRHDKLEQRAAKQLRMAKSSDGMGQPPQRRPVGTWAGSRQIWPSNRFPR